MEGKESIIQTESTDNDMTINKKRPMGKDVVAVNIVG